VFRLLARRAPGGVRPGEMIAALGLKPSTLSVYLAALERAGLIVSKRDGKSILYRIDLNEVGQLIAYLVADCCRGRPELCLPLAAGALQRLEGETPVGDRPFNVLFICTGNSARSIMAEAILAEVSQGNFRAFSAGTRPYSEMNPYALEVLESLGHDISGLRAKNVAEFHGPDAPPLDFVFTLCDMAANEECPPWPGQPITAHWGMPDPVKATGTEAEKALAFKDTYAMLRRRLLAFVALPVSTLDRISLQRRLDAIGQDEAIDAGPA
jgi:ArsR family transcriptional regulator, arsenate/arsenite/antimonite-responsive transcriptional repressor / arsenate reductase (thioredoxin)